jgi:putative DNA primase/helicase
MTSQLPPTDLPALIRGLPNWVVWRFVQRPNRPKPDKMPFQALAPAQVASHSNKSHWTDFEMALRCLEQGGFEGLGFVFSKEANITGIDLDGVIENGVLHPEAAHLVNLFDSYTEVSPSGTGVHIFVTPRWLGQRNRVKKHFGIEVYTEQRFFTITARHLLGTPLDIEERPGELMLLEERHLRGGSASTKLVQTASKEFPESDSDLLALAYRAKGGDALQKLMGGDVVGAGYTHSDGSPNQSAADLALCNRLYFWTGGDMARVERLFRGSGLYRGKWDAKRSGKTYGEMTLERVRQTSNVQFQGQKRKLSF